MNHSDLTSDYKSIIADYKLVIATYKSRDESLGNYIAAIYEMLNSKDKLEVDAAMDHLKKLVDSYK